MSRLDVNLSGLGLVLERLPPAFEERIRGEWAAFLGAAPQPTVLRAAATHRPDSQVRFDPKSLRIRRSEAGGELELPGGRGILDRTGTLEMTLEGPEPESFFNFVNLLVAALALRLPRFDSALLHAAGLVLDGRAFLLVGAAGTGKTTWTRLGVEGGAAALSDDLVLVRGSDALASPFRSKDFPGGSRPGRWPIAALLHPRHGTPSRLAPVPPLVARARIAANLPFLSDFADRSGADAFVDRLTGGVPSLELTFAPEPSFLDRLRSIEGPSREPAG